MKVLVACEFSGVVRDAFLRRGHEALSCDLLPTETPGPHYQGDVRDVLYDAWDLMIAHPPCTYLAVSGARWWAGRQQEQQDAIAFVSLLLEAPIARIALENVAPGARVEDIVHHLVGFMHGQNQDLDAGAVFQNLAWASSVRR